MRISDWSSDVCSSDLQGVLRYDREVRHSINNVPVDARTQYVGNPATGFPNGTDTVPANYYLNPGLDPAYNPSGVLQPLAATFEQFQPKITDRKSTRLNSSH